MCTKCLGYIKLNSHKQRQISTPRDRGTKLISSTLYLHTSKAARYNMEEETCFDLFCNEFVHWRQSYQCHEMRCLKHAWRNGLVEVVNWLLVYSLWGEKRANPFDSLCLESNNIFFFMRMSKIIWWRANLVNLMVKNLQWYFLPSWEKMGFQSKNVSGGFYHLIITYIPSRKKNLKCLPLNST